LALKGNEFMVDILPTERATDKKIAIAFKKHAKPEENKKTVSP
jgi:hypothetical protein